MPPAGFEDRDGHRTICAPVLLSSGRRFHVNCEEHCCIGLAGFGPNLDLFPVEHFVVANLYGRSYTYTHMKRKTRVTKGRRTGALKASAGEAKRSQDVIADVGSLYRPIKRPVTLRVDADVLAWFKKQGRGYQTRINRALRSLMLEERRQS